MRARVDAADLTFALLGEPQIAAGAGDDAVGMARASVGNFVFAEQFTGGGIDLADRPGAVDGEPDVAVRAGRDARRIGACSPPEGYSVTFPSAETRPILSPWYSVNHIAPSGPLVMALGPLPGVIPAVKMVTVGSLPPAPAVRTSEEARTPAASTAARRRRCAAAVAFGRDEKRILSVTLLPRCAGFFDRSEMPVS